MLTVWNGVGDDASGIDHDIELCLPWVVARAVDIDAAKIAACLQTCGVVPLASGALGRVDDVAVAEVVEPALGVADATCVP